jgi:hypothetical protein
MKALTMGVRTSLLAVLILSFLVSPASAHEVVKSVLPANLNSWSTYGTPSVSSTSVTLQGSDRELVYIDINARNMDKAYVVLAAYVSKQDTRRAYSQADRNRSGNPYLYVYYLDRNGKIIKYLSGTQTINTTRSDSDHVVYGVFPTMSGTKTIRVFLKQSSVKNISNSGVDVSFMSPILVEASSKAKAKEIVSAFASQNLTLTYESGAAAAGSTGSTGSTSTTNPPTTTTNLSSSCAGTSGTNIFKIGFESGQAKDASLKFGSSLAAWVYGSHDYPSTISPYDKTTTSQSFAGSYALGLTNTSYGYTNGEAATSPQLYDEALRYITTGKLQKNAKYAFSIRAKYLQGSSSQSSVSLQLAQEKGSDGSGKLVSTKALNAGDSWNCLEYEFTNRESTSTAQDLALFFGNLPKGGSLYIDDIQLIKK